MFDIDPKVLILQEKKYESMSILTLSVLVFESIMKSNVFTPSVFPFIWNYNTTSKYSASVCPIYEFKPVGGIKEQLIIFTEQNTNNVSSKIFRALTGFNACLSDKKRYSLLFKNVNIAEMMNRLKKNRRSPHTSKLLDPPIKKVHILYHKKFCRNQIRKPIIVSSMIQGQSIQINPGPEYEFNMFVVSKDSFDYTTVNRKNYIQNMKRAKEIVQNYSPQMKNMNFLPIQAESLDFTYAGPVCNELLRYECRFILKDESFYKDQ